MGDHIPVIRLLLQQGQTLEVTGYEGAYAKVTAGEKQGLVETGFLRFPDEPFESRTAYALWNAGLYPDFSCLGEPLEKLATNTRLEVLEELEKAVPAYLLGRQSLDDTISKIQDGVKIYLAE